jgi:hypothetical protein
MREIFIVIIFEIDLEVKGNIVQKVVEDVCKNLTHSNIRGGPIY